MQRTLSLAIILLICLASLDAPVQTASRAPVRGAHGMVVSTSPIASDVGIEIMKNGGNAVDAAVAVRFALSVTVPWGGNIGGGGFLVFHDAASGESFTYDYREVAPTRAHRNMYVDVAGEIVPELSTVGHLSAGVPGTVAGLLLALEKHGRLVRQTVLAPAIRLAEEGFPVSYENRWGLHHRRGLEELSGGGTRADRGFLPRSYHCIDGTTELGGHHPEMLNMVEPEDLSYLGRNSSKYVHLLTEVATWRRRSGQRGIHSHLERASVTRTASMWIPKPKSGSGPPILEWTAKR